MDSNDRSDEPSAPDDAQDDPQVGVTRTRVRRSRPAARPGLTGRGHSSRRRQTRTSKPLLLLGVGLIVAGVAVLVWVAWQFWGTNWASHQRHEQVTDKLGQSWSGGQDTAVTKFGKATAILHVPRFGKDYGVPVLEGDSEEVLAAGIAHFPGTAGPGQAGNYALAAHRVTHGEPFRMFPSLRAGDKVFVETRTTTYEYNLDNSGTSLVVPMSDTWVIDRSPVNPTGGVQPIAGSNRLITLVTCSELFHTDNRSVVFGHLIRAIPKTGPVAPTATADPSGGVGPLWWILAAVALLLVLGIWAAKRRLR